MIRRNASHLTVVLAGFLIGSPLLAVDTTRLVPIVLDVASGSARYTTELALTNRGASAVTATLRYHPSLGATVGGTATLPVPAGQQLVLPDVIALLREKGISLPVDEPQAGTLEVAFSGAQSGDVVAATARTGSAVASPEGRAGLAYGALREGSTSRLTVYGLRESASDRSNLAFLSTSADPVTVKVTVRSGSGDGKSVVLREAESLPPFGWIQIGRVLSEAGLTNGWAEIERVAGSGSFSAYGVVNDNVTNDGSFLPSVPDGRIGSRLTVPVVAETANLASELVLANRASSPVTLTLSYVRSLTAPDGGDGTTTLTLAPREQRILPDALSFLRGAGVPVGPAGETHVGSLRITVSGAPLDQVFAAARTGFKSGAGSFGLFTPAVSPAEEAADEVVLYGLRADETNRTNVAVVNSGPDAAGPVTLELRTYDGDASGVEKGSPIRQTLAPGQHAQVNLILGDAGIRNGWVRARRVDGTAPWLAYGVVNDGGVPGQRTGDGAYVPMELTDPVAQGAGSFLVKNGDVTLAGTLDLPSTPGPYPVMVFIAGSGTADRQSDRSAGGILLPQGIALFTFDKRGVGQSTGTYQNVNVENSARLIPERASDVVAIVSFLSRHRDIDPRRIFLWGTSQGGWVAPLVALKTENVAFLICVNGGGSSVGVEVYYETLTRNQSLSISQATAMLAGYTGPTGYDPDAALRALGVPALFVYGGMDRNNPTFADIPRVDKIKAELGKDFTTFLFPNTNHDLIDVTTGTFDPQLFPKIVEWSRARIGAVQ